jgi:hypothetical protein
LGRAKGRHNAKASCVCVGSSLTLDPTYVLLWLCRCP